MSLYDMLMGINEIGVFFIVPMLDKHPDDFPRFRNAFINDKDHKYPDYIHIFTRVGGPNRRCGYGEEELYEHPNFIDTFDDDLDNTYASYVFSVPNMWKKDFELIKKGKLEEVSKKYQKQVRKIFPKLESKFDELWGK